ncbi:hypothetical protein [Prevotella sp.]|uniref:hypothetical protein n=1 Tax=Prevotella sp. TaxID=59823 RepID=UPI00307867CB
MNKVFLILLIASAALAVVQAHQLTEAQYDREQIKEDVRLLMNDIDEYGDIDTYTGSDHFERLYEWSHNLKNKEQ